MTYPVQPPEGARQPTNMAEHLATTSMLQMAFMPFAALMGAWWIAAHWPLVFAGSSRPDLAQTHHPQSLASLLQPLPFGRVDTAQTTDRSSQHEDRSP